MASPTSPSQATLTTLTPLRSWPDEWRAFRSLHPQWRSRVDGGDPVYCLPQAAVKRMSFSHPRLPRLLEEKAEGAENAFTDLCTTNKAVGCWLGSPIRYSLLQPELPLSEESLLRAAGWTAAQIRNARRGVELSQDAARRRKGCIGWLLTEPAFLEDIGQLTNLWEGLPADRRPAFPLGRSIVAAEQNPEWSDGGRPLAEFMRRLTTFLDRWGLIQLTTWDLPDPQGPLLPDLLPPMAPARPDHGVHLYLPFHHALQGDDGLLQRVQELQRQAALAAGVDESLAGLPHHKVYASMADVIHLERTMRSRFPANNAPRGLVGVVVDAAADVLHVGTDYVRKLRKAIESCRRGGRGRIAWLRRGHP